MTLSISRELPLFIFERLYMWCTLIGHPFEKLWPFKFLESFRCSISSVSTYYAPESDIRGKSYDHLNFSRASVVQFRASVYWCAWIGHPCEKLWPFEFLKSFRCLISSVSIYCKPELELSMKSYDHFDFSKAFVVQFRATRHIMSPNLTFVWKHMTILISQELSLFNLERLDIL